MSVKANKDQDSILADAKELLKILIPAERERLNRKYKLHLKLN
jgi:hypothetical protein